MGDLPAGVDFYKKTGKYRAQIKVAGKRRHLGYFECPDAAAAAYQAELPLRGNDNVERVRRFLLANLGCSKKEVICALRLNPRTVAKAIRIIRSERDHGRDH